MYILIGINHKYRNVEMSECERYVSMHRKRRRALRTKRETYVHVCSLFPTENRRNARSEHTKWHYLLHPVPKASDTIPSRGSRNPLLSLFFTRSRINPTCRVFRSNDAARENVSLYLKIDIYAHPGADSRYSEDASRFEGHRTLVFFCHVRFRFLSREFVDQQGRLVNCTIYVDNIS